MKSLKFVSQIPDSEKEPNKRRKTIAKPIVILVKPEHGGNIGAIMRAMANFGLEELRIVQPKENWLNFDCVKFAMGAMEHLKVLRRCDTLYDALADIQMSYALTVRSRHDIGKKVLTPAQAMQNAKSFTSKWAFVMGSEVNGLDNKSVVMCNDIITIPTNSSFSSMNLSQATVVCCYAWHAVAGHLAVRNVMVDSPEDQADTKKIQHMLKCIYNKLSHNDLLTKTPNGLEITMQHIQNLVMRLQPTDQEIALFYRVTDVAKSYALEVKKAKEKEAETLQIEAEETENKAEETANNTETADVDADSSDK